MIAAIVDGTRVWVRSRAINRSVAFLNLMAGSVLNAIGMQELDGRLGHV